jgi:hypothetical protein
MSPDSDAHRFYETPYYHRIDERAMWLVEMPGQAEHLGPFCLRHAHLAAAMAADAVVRSVAQPLAEKRPCGACEREPLTLWPLGERPKKQGGGERRRSGRQRGKYDVSDDLLEKRARDYLIWCAKNGHKPSKRGLARHLSMSASWARERMERLGIQLPNHIPDLHTLEMLPMAAALCLALLYQVDASDGRVDHQYNTPQLAPSVYYQAPPPEVDLDVIPDGVRFFSKRV